MNLSQLRYLCEIVRCRLNISRAAAALRTSQPAMSQQIRALEDELGVPLFVRTRNRLIRLTDAGQNVVEAANSALTELAKVQTVARTRMATQFASLRIGCTHAQARYALPRVARAFRRRYPAIQLELTHKHDEELWQLVQNGQMDIAITTDAQSLPKGLLYLPCSAMKRLLIAPRNHPVLRLPSVTLEAIAEYPLVTFNDNSSGRRRLLRAFSAHGLTPKISATAEDEDVIKEFVREGLGITILASIVYDAKRDGSLGAVDVTRLLEPSTTGIIVRKNMLKHEPIKALIEMYAPIWTDKRLELTKHEN